MNRRGFMQAILAAAVAPAVVKAASLMPTVATESGVLTLGFDVGNAYDLIATQWIYFKDRVYVFGPSGHILTSEVPNPGAWVLQPSEPYLVHR